VLVKGNHGWLMELTAYYVREPALDLPRLPRDCSLCVYRLLNEWYDTSRLSHN